MTAGGITPAALARTCVGLLIFAVALAYVRAGTESRSAYRAGETADADGDWQSAVLHYRHSAQWHAPMIGRSGEALAALIEIGDDRAEVDDLDGALVAYRSARFAIMATRHLTTPHAELLPDLHAKIASHMATQVDGRGNEEARFLAQLDAYEDRRPNPMLSLGASLGFLLWLASLAMMAWRGFEPDGRPRARPFLGWLASAVAFLSIWLVCVRFA